jgi:uncharacterized OB-fold protein
MNEKKREDMELLSISSGEASQPFNWSVGKHGSYFLQQLRDHKRIVGIRCPKCKRVYVPPRPVCGRCFAAMDEMVPLSDEGTIYVCTIVQFGFVDPSTGVQRPVPYTWAFVKLDGADTCLTHFLDSVDPEKVKVGARVKAVFEEKRTGNLMDIKHFAVL